MAAHTGVTVRASTSPSAPIVGQGVNLAVRVVERRVEADGIAREVPLPGLRVEVQSSGWTEMRSSDDTDVARVTDSDGVVVFEYRCDRVTSVTATAIVGDAAMAFALDPPSCSPVPTTTTTTTTTTAPAASSSSTPATTATTRG